MYIIKYINFKPDHKMNSINFIWNFPTPTFLLKKINFKIFQFFFHFLYQINHFLLLFKQKNHYKTKICIFPLIYIYNFISHQSFLTTTLEKKKSPKKSLPNTHNCKTEMHGSGPKVQLCKGLWIFENKSKLELASKEGLLTLYYSI